MTIRKIYKVILSKLQEDVTFSTFLQLTRLQWVGHMIRKYDFRIREQEMGGDVGGRRPLGKSRVRWKDAFCRYAADLLQIRNWKAARSGKV
jgi:hypothetical protein